MWKPVQLTTTTPKPAPTTEPPSPAEAAATNAPSSPAPAPPAQPGSEPAPDSAVRRCCSAYHQALAAAGGRKISGARDAAKDAYRDALPFLSTRASIADFIACITQGMVLGVFWREEGPQLIAAAKAGLAALPPESRAVSRPVGRPAGRPRENPEELHAETREIDPPLSKSPSN